MFLQNELQQRKECKGEPKYIFLSNGRQKFEQHCYRRLVYHQCHSKKHFLIHQASSSLINQPCSVFSWDHVVELKNKNDNLKVIPASPAVQCYFYDPPKMANLHMQSCADNKNETEIPNPTPNIGRNEKKPTARQRKQENSV